MTRFYYPFFRSKPKTRLRKLPLADWQTAYGLRGKGTTVTRRYNVRSIFQSQIPVPESRSDRASEIWMEEIEKVVVAVVEQLQKEAELVGGIQYPSDQPRLVSLTGL